MGKIFLAALLFTSFNFYAQGQRGGNGVGGRQPQNQNRQQGERKVVKFKASNVAGIFYYNAKRVTKKIKVKDDEKAAIIKQAILEYNTKIKEIAFVNSEKFKSLNEMMNSLRNSQSRNQQNNDADERQEMRKKIGEVIRPARRDIRAEEEKLNAVMKEILDKKQNNKWLKYQKAKKKSLEPERPERRGNQRSSQNGQRSQMRRQ